MAILQSSTIDKLTVANNVTASGEISSNPEVASVFFNSITDYTATGPIANNGTHVLQKIDRLNSGARFTVLEAGLYFVMWHNISNANGSTNRTYIRVNGARWSQARGEGSPDYPMVNAFVLNFMNVGDFFDIDHGAGQIYLTTQYNDFVIFKVT